jgi:hypothetical protein
VGWAKLDDAFPTNPKVVGLSDRAFRAYILALCYAAQHMTDGFVPVAWSALVIPRKTRQELEAAGLWEPVQAGWQIHDYLTYNPTRKQAEERRENQRAQRSAAGKARAAKSQRAAGRFTSGKPAEPLAPATSPVPSRTHPPVVGVDLEPDTPNAVGNIAAGAAWRRTSQKAKAPTRLGDRESRAVPPGNARPASPAGIAASAQAVSSGHPEKGREAEAGNGSRPFHLADVVNLGLVVSLTDRYRRRGWEKSVTAGLLTGLVLGSEKHGIPACGPRAVNAAIDDLYANAANVKDPAGYLKERAAAYAQSESP